MILYLDPRPRENALAHSDLHLKRALRWASSIVTYLQDPPDFLNRWFSLPGAHEWTAETVRQMLTEYEIRFSKPFYDADACLWYTDQVSKDPVPYEVRAFPTDCLPPRFQRMKALSIVRFRSWYKMIYEADDGRPWSARQPPEWLRKFWDKLVRGDDFTPEPTFTYNTTIYSGATLYSGMDFGQANWYVVGTDSSTSISWSPPVQPVALPIESPYPSFAQAMKAPAIRSPVSPPVLTNPDDMLSASGYGIHSMTKLNAYTLIDESLE